MRAFVTTFGFLAWTFSFGQNCYCDKDTILKEIINCDKINFDNKASIYWSFNCDSSWLTFESPTHKKEIIYSLGDGLQELTGRLGFIYVQEYKQSFLIQNNVISGCCDPPEFFLFDKTSGQIKDSLGCLIFYSEDQTLPFTVSLTNSSYDSGTNKKFNGNSLTLYNVEKHKKYFIKLPAGQIDKAIKKTGEMFPEHLFDEPILKGATLVLTYSLDRTKDKQFKQTKTVIIDLKKYSR